MNFFVLPDGRRLAWRAEGRGKPLVLLHGWSMSSVVFSEALAALSGDFRVLAPDLRGHGDSDPGNGYTFADFAGDLRLWMEALELSACGLLGWSMGGQVALELRGMLPGRIDRLLLVDATPRFVAGDDWTHGLPDLQVQAMGRSLKDDYPKTMGNFFELMFAGEDLPRERHRQLAAMTAHAGCLPAPDVALASLETLRRADQRAQLSGISCPTLVMHGDRDVIILPSAGGYLAERIAGARLALCPGVSHAPFLSHPDEVFRQWRDFFLQ